jgi:Ankyrin repeats (3 copies)
MNTTDLTPMPLVSKFESAADAIVIGDTATLESLLSANPELVRAHSTRVHHATLLHYVGANGVENYRQKTPPNAVAITKILLNAGAEVDALADTYGKGTTLGLVASSVHPERAGVQIALMETLLDHGAAVDGVPESWNPLKAAIFNGRKQAAEFLAMHGAQIDLLAAAALGRLDLLMTFFDNDGSVKPPATKQDLNSGCVYACLYGRTTAAEFLLDRGADLREEENTGQTGLHNAVICGDLNLIRLLLSRDAPLEARNRFGGTVLGQATWCAMNDQRNIDYAPIIQVLLDAGANVEKADYPTGINQIDDILRHHGAES